MNRELKFRLWNTVRKDMNYDGGMQMLGNKLIQDEHNILMQFTGLKDKQGKEIYEGDIVIFKNDICKIEFWMSEFIMRDKLGGGYSLYLEDDIEVIGNIYENPELLNDKGVKNE